MADSYGVMSTSVILSPDAVRRTEGLLNPVGVRSSRDLSANDSWESMIGDPVT